MSNKFAAKDISNGSLNQITTTGFYFGSNITEVTPYIKSHKWCLINAYVSGNSASIFVIAGDAIALSIYRNGDGIYSYYPIATKSDLSSFLDVVTAEYTVTLSANQSTITSGSVTIKNGYTPLPKMLSVRTIGSDAVFASGDNYYENGKIHVYIKNTVAAERTIKVMASMLCYKS